MNASSFICIYIKNVRIILYSNRTRFRSIEHVAVLNSQYISFLLVKC